MTYLSDFVKNFIDVFVESAPWLLLGYLIAGLIKALIPSDFLNKHLGQSNSLAVFKGAIFGAPLPLCSCGVIPAALGLRRAGASKAATTSFLIATPETGVDSVLVTHALLGPFMAVIRPIAAVTTAITAGLMVMLFDKKHNGSATAEHSDKTACCSSKKTEASSCCASKKPQSASARLLEKLKTGLSFSLVDIIKDTVLWLLIGLLIAAVIMTIVPPEFIAKWGATPYAYLLMTVIGIPMYICATASTPIAAGLLFAGVSPGAILIFLLIGPATNIATLAIVKNELGKSVLVIYLTVIALLSWLFGLLTDVLAERFTVAVSIAQNAHLHTNMVSLISAAVLFLLLLNGLRLKYFQ